MVLIDALREQRLLWRLRSLDVGPSHIRVELEPETREKVSQDGKENEDQRQGKRVLSPALADIRELLPRARLPRHVLEALENHQPAATEDD